MVSQRNLENDQNLPMVSQIRVRGHLGQEWTEWFGGLTITLEDDGTTLFTGLVVDQAALHGLLKKLRNLGMPLLSFTQMKPEEGDLPAGQSRV